MLARPTALAAALFLSFFAAAPALASCAPPATVAENAARAHMVVHGQVVRVNETFAAGGNFTFRVDQVLKGSAPAQILVHVGPVPGTATSVDYGGATAGSEQTLYLRLHGTAYTTDACNGSHQGAPTSEEQVFFGQGSAPTAVAPSGEFAGMSWIAPIGAALVLLAVALAAIGVPMLLLRTRSSRTGDVAGPRSP